MVEATTIEVVMVVVEERAMEEVMVVVVIVILRQLDLRLRILFGENRVRRLQLLGGVGDGGE